MLLWWFSVKESACYCRRQGLIPGLERSSGEGNGNALQYCCLEYNRDRGALRSIVHEVTKESDMTWCINNNNITRKWWNSQCASLQTHLLLNLLFIMVLLIINNFALFSYYIFKSFRTNFMQYLSQVLNISCKLCINIY